MGAPTRAAAQAPRGRPERRVSAREDDRAVAVHEDAVLRMEADGLGEDAAFHVLAERHHVLRGVGVRDAGDVLLDDRPLVQVGGHVVGCRADQLDAAIVGLRVGARPLKEGRKEWWMLMTRPCMARQTWSERICM